MAFIKNTKLGGKQFSTIKAMRKFFFLMLGVNLFIGSFLLNSITIHANSLSYRETDYQDEIPNDIREYCELVGNEYNICPELLEAMAYRESRFIPTVKNGNHYGLLQVNVKVHADRIENYGWTAEDMLDPYKNLMVAADLLAELYETYGDENPIVLSIYSGNWNAVNKYKEYGFICPYVEDVLNRSANYERLHGK